MRRLAELWATCVDVYDTWIVSAAPGLSGSRALRPGEGGVPVPARPLRRDAGADRRLLRSRTVDAPDAAQHPRRAARRSTPRVPSDAVFLRGLRAFGSRSEAASIYPGVENLLLTARALGLGATLTTWHLMIEADFKRVLGIPRGVHTFAVIPVGWPVGSFGPVRRRPLAEVVHHDRWGGSRPNRSADGQIPEA